MWPETRLLRIASFLTVLMPVLLLGSTLADIGLCSIALLFLAHCYQSRNWQWCRERWAQLLGILWLYMIARGLLAEHPGAAQARSLPFGRYIIFAAALARWTLRDERVRCRFLAILCLFVTAAALDGLIQWGFGRDILFHPIIHDPTGGHIRLTGPFGRPILGIMLAWLLFPAVLPLFFAPSCTPHRGGKLLGAAGAMLVILAAIVFSGERMALMLTLLGCLLAALLLPLRRRVLFSGLAGVAALLAALALLSPGTLHRQVFSTADTLEHWQTSPYGLLLQSDLALAGLHPITGLGAAQFTTRCQELYAGDRARIAAMCNTHPHNIYLEWLIEEGSIGLTLFVAFVACVLIGAFRSHRRDPRNAVLISLFIAFSLRVWPLMSTTDFASRWGAPPFWLVLGALLVYTAQKTEKTSDADSAVTLQNPGV